MSEANVVVEDAAVEGTVEPELATTSTAQGLDALGSSPVLLLSVLLPLLLFALTFLRRKKSSGNRVLLFGPVGGGKSALYHRLKHGRVIPTVSSMEPTSGTFVPLTGGGAPLTKQLNVCDMPGSGRLRDRLKAEAAGAAALVCVVDGTQLAAHARETAGMLFDVFSQEGVVRRPPALLVAVNKSDVATCAAPAAARKSIEQEVQRVRLARTTMEDTSGRDTQVGV